MRKTILMLAVSIWVCSLAANGQNLRVTGTVTSVEEGFTLPGATVSVKGTAQGTTTDVDGKYSITVQRGAVLQFSYIGMAPQELTIEREGVYDVALAYSAITMQEVVVTALGIKRERKSLGYAIQDVSGETLLQGKEASVANSLTGKVSGLQVIRSSTGPAGSSKIVLRGNNSLTGDNQPLIVVDGVPLSNFTGAENNDMWNPSLDMGSGIGDINSEDIESVSVLKGASAAALYGSRAGNGVILITTKSGRKKDGLGISVSSSLGVESLFTHPEIQNTYGQGSFGTYDKLSNLSWGPQITGQMVENWNGQQVAMGAPDNVGSFFNSGISHNHNVSFQQMLQNVSVFTSLSHRDEKSVIPGAELYRTNILTRASSKFGQDDRWSVDAKVQYFNTKVKNRPLLGVNYSNPYYTLYRLPRSLNILDFQNPVNNFGSMVWYDGSQQLNPYWTTQYNLNQDTRDRLLLSGTVKYDVTKWLNAELSAGTDIYTTNTQHKLHSGSPLSVGGRYSKGKETYFEHNVSALITAKDYALTDKFGASLSLGGNIMMQERSGLRSNADDLVVPNLFSLNNNSTRPSVSEWFSQRRSVSLYGITQLSWDNYLYLDATFRNDWSSTLITENQSFFYPSLSASWVVTDMLEKFNTNYPSLLTFAKLRASIAQVGNSLEPYRLFNTFSIGTDPLGVVTGNVGPVKFDPLVRSELITSKEIGVDLRFFQNRLGIDFAWYKTNATRQLIEIPMDPLSGFQRQVVNAGDIQNTGIELMLTGRIIDNRNFKWESQINFSTNKNTVEMLTDEVLQYRIGGFDDLQVMAEVGALFGQIYGTTFRRVTDENSEHYGKLLLTAAGLPTADPERKMLGSQQPDALLGLTNTFSFRGLSLSFMIDGRFGGKMFSASNAFLQSLGVAAVTAPGGKREDFVVDGVIASGSGTYTTNTTSITQQEYWGAVSGTGNLGIIEANLYDATNVRLRYVTLNYAIPKGILGKSPIKNATFGVTVNNVWLMKSHLNGIDPESVYATGTNAIGFENSAPPTTRNVVFNLNLSF